MQTIAGGKNIWMFSARNSINSTNNTGYVFVNADGQGHNWIASLTDSNIGFI